MHSVNKENEFFETRPLTVLSSYITEEVLVALVNSLKIHKLA